MEWLFREIRRIGWDTVYEGKIVNPHTIEIDGWNYFLMSINGWKSNLPSFVEFYGKMSSCLEVRKLEGKEAIFKEKKWISFSTINR